jgi:hypothetical protein
MHTLYDSDTYAVVLFEDSTEVDGASGASSASPIASGHGGYEIVDKFARKEIYISGSLAESFRSGVEALIESSPNEDDIDEFLGRFSALMLQPLNLH